MIVAFISANVSKCSVIHQIKINVGFHVGGGMVELGKLASAQNSGLRNHLEAKVMDLEDGLEPFHASPNFVPPLSPVPALRGHPPPNPNPNPNPPPNSNPNPPVTSGTEQTCV